jgi:hypothetical protein
MPAWAFVPTARGDHTKMPTSKSPPPGNWAKKSLEKQIALRGEPPPLSLPKPFL